MRNYTIAACMLLAMPVFAQKKALDIKPFEYSTVMTDVQAIFGTQVNIGQGIAALLTNRVTRGGKFTVIERARVGDLIKEQDFGASGRVKKGTQARIGQIRGADLILMGDIVTFGRDDSRKRGAVGVVVPGAGGAAGGYRSEGKAVVTLNYRILDAETSEVVSSGEARGESKRVSKGGFAGLFIGGVGVGGGMDMTKSNFAETIIGEAVIDACDKLSEQINGQQLQSSTRDTSIEGAVAAVEGGQVYLNVGSSSGVQVGDVFTIEKIVREVRDPATKEVLDVVTQPLGSLTVTSVRDKIAIGSWSGGAMPKPGDRAIKK